MWKSKTAYRLILDAASDPIIIYDPEDGQILDVNQAAVEASGYSFQELIKFNISDLYLNKAETSEEQAQKIRNLTIKEGPQKFEWQTKIKDGRHLWVEIITKAAVIEDRQVIIAVIRDITKRKRNEETLQKTQEENIFLAEFLDNALIAFAVAYPDGISEQNKFLSELLEISSVPFAIAEPEGSLIYTNKAFSELTGYSNEELKQITWNRDLTPIKWREHVSQQLKELNKTGKSVRYQRELICKDGNRKIVEMLTHVKKDEKGNPSLYYDFITDITERVKIERALAESEEKYRSVVENMSDGVIIYDFRTKLMIQSNKAAQNILGYTEDEMLKLRNYDIVYDSKENIDMYLEKSMYDNLTWIGERPYKCKDGTIRIVEVTSKPIKFGGIEVISIVFKDITEKKKMEEELEAYHHNLEELVKNRTMELERINKELESFTYTVSHDLKSPLTTIKGFVSILEQDIKDTDNEAVNRDLSRINKTVDKMGYLMDDLLELSRVGKVSGVSTPILLEDIINEVKTTLASQTSQSGVVIKQNCTIKSVFADKDRIVQVFQNLIENSIKYMGNQEKPSIEIGCSSNECEIVFYVKDNGVGIEEKDFIRVFGLFERLNKKVEGTGIGLAIVKRIIESLKGRIWVESEGKDKGSTFFFTLPINPDGSQT